MGYIPGKKNELMEIDRLYESISSFSFKKNILKEGTLDITDISGTSTFKSKKLPTDKYFIVHHTAGRGVASQVIDVLNTRGLGIHWIIDRDGKLFKGLPSGAKGAHVTSLYPSAPKDLSNSSSQGVEIIAKEDNDILIPQCKTALKLVKSLNYPLSNIYGHGEVSSNKMKTEGATCKAYMKKYWNTPESELPDSDPSLGKSEPDKEKTKENKKKENSPYSEGFCACLKKEKQNKTSSKFLEAAKKCEPSKTDEYLILMGSKCAEGPVNLPTTTTTSIDTTKTTTSDTTTTTSDSTTTTSDSTTTTTTKKIPELKFTDIFKSALKEEKISKDVDKVKNILKKVL